MKITATIETWVAAVILAVTIGMFVKYRDLEPIKRPDATSTAPIRSSTK